MHTACGCGLSLVNNHFLKKKAETHAGAQRCTFCMAILTTHQLQIIRSYQRKTHLNNTHNIMNQNSEICLKK